MSYGITYAKPTQHHLEILSRRQQKILFDAVEEQLTHEPTVETKRRKRMRPNPLATWELRIGILRAYYDVFAVPEPTVLVVAIGIKEGSILRIGGQVVAL